MLVVCWYLGLNLYRARRRFGVKTPAMYGENKKRFNCIVRAYQHTQEQLPIFLVLLLLVGLVYPRYAALCGAIYVSSCITSSHGYYSGNPEKRFRGNYGALGWFGLFFALLHVGCSMLMRRKF